MVESSSSLEVIHGVLQAKGLLLVQRVTVPVILSITSVLGDKGNTLGTLCIWTMVLSQPYEFDIEYCR
jgi:hypothetical protein